MDSLPWAMLMAVLLGHLSAPSKNDALRLAFDRRIKLPIRSAELGLRACSNTLQLAETTAACRLREESRVATGRAAAVTASGARITRYERRARRRTNWHSAKMPQVPHQTRSIMASRPNLGVGVGISATRPLPDVPVDGTIIAGGRSS